MRYSRALLLALHRAPADGTSKSRLFLRRPGRVGAGIYGLLPLGARVLLKIEAIVRREVNMIAAQLIARRIRELLGQAGTKAN